MDLVAFHEEFFQDISAAGGADGRWKAGPFFEKFRDVVVDAAEIATAPHPPSPRLPPPVPPDPRAADPPCLPGALPRAFFPYPDTP